MVADLSEKLETNPKLFQFVQYEIIADCADTNTLDCEIGD